MNKKHFFPFPKKGEIILEPSFFIFEGNKFPMPFYSNKYYFIYPLFEWSSKMFNLGDDAKI